MRAPTPPPGVPLLALALALAGCPTDAPGPSAAGVDLEAQASRLAAADQRFDRLEAALAARDDRLQRLEDALGLRDRMLEEQSAALATLQRSLSSTHATLATLQTTLAQAGLDGDAGRDLAARVRALVERAEEAASDRASAGRRVEALEAAIADTRVALTALQGSLQSERARLDETRDDLGRVAADLTAAQRVVNALRKHSPVPNIEREVPEITGRVLLVHASAAGPALLLSVGSKDGVRPLYEFTVRRGDRVVGKIRATDVTDGFSTAHILVLDEGERVKEGDRITTQG